MTKNEVHKKGLQCEHCRSPISFGGDVICVEQCVNGPRGVIPLGEVLRFCSEDCVSRYFDHDSTADLPKVPRQIP